MTYQAKTNWNFDEIVTEEDLNRIEQGIKDSHDKTKEAETNAKNYTDQQLAAHKLEKATDTTLGHVTLQQLGMRNVLINGLFDTWQRGTEFLTTANTYTADRWRLVDMMDASSTVTRQVSGAEEHAILPYSRFFLRLERHNALAGNLQQRVEDVRVLAGEKVTLSFIMKAQNAETSYVQVHQFFGSGGSETVTVLSTSFSLGTTYQKYVFTFDMPSVDGKIIGANSFVSLYIARNSTINTYDVLAVKLERGDIATPFERVPFGLELAMCQRYFCKTYGASVPPGTLTSNGALIARANGAGSTRSLVNFRFPVEMRATPTITMYSPNTGAIGKAYNTATVADIDASTMALTTSGVVLTHTTSVNDHESIHYHATADAEL